MRFIDEYRDPKTAHRLGDALARITTRPWNIMEVCGGQTHAIVRFGIDGLLPDAITLIHGPGCPVCVTPVAMIDAALDLAARPDVIFCSFGDMLRVPGTKHDLLQVKSQGGDVRVVYSPLDALDLARNNPSREVVFFAVGFETTAPANAMAAYQAKKEHLNNFSMLVSHVLVPPALEAILAAPENRVQGLLAAGHVCTIMGEQEYLPIARTYHTPIVITGFEPLDILQGVYMCAKQLEEGRAVVENQYTRSVKIEGNVAARHMIEEVFDVIPRAWRGIGTISDSGLALREEYVAHDAIRKFDVMLKSVDDPGECISGLILQGIKTPPECPAFGTRCTPDHPLGATMVSTEGACAAYHRYRANSRVCPTTAPNPL